MSINSREIKERALELGFVLAGISQAGAVPQNIATGLSEHLAGGNHAGMRYLAENLAKRLDVTALVPGAHSVISCAVSYGAGWRENGCGADSLYIARYARQSDYHETVRHKLRQLADWLAAGSSAKSRFRCFVDTAPLLEKYYAVQAGLGWLGRNNLLINKDYGSWLLLGEIVTNLELEYDTPDTEGGCGECRRCVDACPGGAIHKAGQFDSRLCLSYHTIESKTEIPAEMVARFSGHFFGCDDCQLVCPYNTKSVNTAASCGAYAGLTASELAVMTEEQFGQRFGHTPLTRCGLERLKYIASLK